MNLFQLGFSSWIILLNIILFLILFLQLLPRFKLSLDSFVNYPQQVDPETPIKDTPDISAANNNYASLLMFLKKNPSQSAKFIIDIKQKFFNDQCQVKDYIDFNEIATFSDGMPFK